MGKDSFAKQALRLNISDKKKVAALRNTSREWLENACDNSDRNMAELLKKQDQLRKQAHRFVDHDGVRFFGEAIKEKVIKGLRDPKLIDIMTKMMLIQCRNKEKKLKQRKEKEMARLEAESDAESEEVQDSSDSRTSVALEDTEYSPSVITPDTPSNFRQHYTRANAQPGMPPIRSIEVHSDDGLIVVGTQRSNIRGEANPERTSGKDKTIASSKKCVNQQKNSQSIPDETSRYDTDIIASSPSTRMDSAQQAHNVLASQLPALWRGLTPIRRDQASQPILNPIHDASHMDNLLSLPMLDPNTFDFDQFIESARYRTESVAVRTAPPTVSTLLAPVERVKSPLCQQTPPGSGRSRRESRSLRNERPNELDSKPQLPGMMDDVIDLTGGDKTTVFITPVDCKVILKDKAALSLQRSLNLLNNASLKYQRLAQDSPTSLDREKAKDKALFIGELLNELKDSRRIWDDGSQLETDPW